MKVLFWLYKSHINKKGLSPVMMRITILGQRINFPTSICIEEKAWDKDKQQIKKSNDLSPKYNQLLLNFKYKAWEFYTDNIRQDRGVTPVNIRDYILGVNTSHYTLLDALEYQINHLKARVGTD